MRNKLIRNGVIAFLFVLSGAAALMYQVVWFKNLSYFLGNTTHAQTVVLAVFMGGMALGSWWWGKRADRIKNTLKLFAWLEISIALYCVLYIPFFEWIKNLFVSFVSYYKLPSDSSMVLFLKLLVSAFTLLLPTFLIGGTLPVLVKYLSDKLEKVGKTVAILYFINSIGAVIGIAVAGFYLFHKFGLTATTFIAASMDVFVGLFFLILAGKNLSYDDDISNDISSPKNKQINTDIVFVSSKTQFQIALIIVGFSGFCSMIYEIAWVRVLIPILSSTTYSFTLVTGTFITGISIGSLITYFLLHKVKNPFRFLGFCQILIALSLLLTLPFYEKIPFLIWQTIGDGIQNKGNYNAYLLTQFYYIFVIMVIPTTLMGISLPVANSIVVKNISSNGEYTGKTFAINTLGTVLGSLLAGLILIPLIGIRRTIEMALILNLFMSVLALYLPNVLRKKWKLLITGLLGLSVAYYYYSVNDESWTYSIMTSEISRKVNRKHPPATFQEFIQTQKNNNEILFYKEGTGGTIAVTKHKNEISLFTNGKGDASSVFDLRTQVSLGHTPVILHPSPDSVFVIGFGAGTTIGSVLTHPQVRYAEVAEISPEVIEASVHFEHINQQPLKDSRLKVIRDDGLSALRLSPYQYDIIISQPSNPWSAGVGNLFTVEFFEECRKKLKPGGYVAQWFSHYELDDNSLRMILRTVLAQFEHVTLWHIGFSDILLLCSKTPFDFNLSKIEESYNMVKEKLEPANIHSFSAFLSQQLISSERGITEYSGTGVLNTEDHPLLELWSPKSCFLNASPNEFKAIDERSHLNKSDLLLKKFIDKMGTLSSEEILQVGLFQSICGNKELAYEFADKNPQIYFAWAKKAINKNNYEKAIEYLDRAERISYNPTLIYREKARIMAMKGDDNAALKLLDKAIYENDTVAETYFNRGMIKNLLKDQRGAIYDLTQAIRLNPSYSQAYYFRGEIHFNYHRQSEACSDWSIAKKMGFKPASYALEKNCR